MGRYKTCMLTSCITKADITRGMLSSRAGVQARKSYLATRKKPSQSGEARFSSANTKALWSRKLALSQPYIFGTQGQLRSAARKSRGIATKGTITISLSLSPLRGSEVVSEEAIPSPGAKEGGAAGAFVEDEAGSTGAARDAVATCSQPSSPFDFKRPRVKRLHTSGVAGTRGLVTRPLAVAAGHAGLAREGAAGVPAFNRGR